MIRQIVSLIVFLRTFFWRLIFRVWGGKLGRNVSIYEGVKFYSGSNAKLAVGDECTFQKGAVIAASENGKIRLGQRVYVGEYTILSSRDSIEIGDDAVIASHVFIVDFDHVFEDPQKRIMEQGYRTAPVRIGKDVWLGAGCKILKGVNLGDGCVIGAGSVVLNDVPPYTVYAGVPAKKIRDRAPAASKILS